MTGTLDLRPCSAAIRERYFDMLVIPVRIGRHGKDLDVIEELCDSGFVARQKWRSSWRMRQRARSRANLTIPLGIDLHELPPAAVLTLGRARA